jgi:hypothetical protein
MSDGNGSADTDTRTTRIDLEHGAGPLTKPAIPRHQISPVTGCGHTSSGSRRVTSRGVVEFLNTVRVSGFSLGGGEFWEYHRLVDDFDRVVHGRQLQH